MDKRPTDIRPDRLTVPATPQHERLYQADSCPERLLIFIGLYGMRVHLNPAKSTMFARR